MCTEAACSASSSRTGESVLKSSHWTHLMWVKEFANNSGRESGESSSNNSSRISLSAIVSSVEAGGPRGVVWSASPLVLFLLRYRGVPRGRVVFWMLRVRRAIWRGDLSWGFGVDGVEGLGVKMMGLLLVGFDCEGGVVKGMLAKRLSGGE